MAGLFDVGLVRLAGCGSFTPDESEMCLAQGALDNGHVLWGEALEQCREYFRWLSAVRDYRCSGAFVCVAFLAFSILQGGGFDDSFGSGGESSV